MDQIRYGWMDRQSPSLDTGEPKSKIFLPHSLSPTPNPTLRFAPSVTRPLS